MILKTLKKRTRNLKSWQWFLMLYIAGFMAVFSASYGIKLLMTGLA